MKKIVKTLILLLTINTVAMAEKGSSVLIQGMSASAILSDIFAAAPVERILVETDAPYLAPPPHCGKRNEPAYTAFTAQVGADVFGMSLTDFAAQTEANFERLFWKAV